MKTNLVPTIAGCLMLALVSTGCGQSNWKDTGTKCLGTDWKNPSAADLKQAATVFQGICEKDKVASDLRCKNERLEVQCK